MGGKVRAHSGDPAGAPDLAAIRDQGYRLTPQRQLVLEAVTVLGHATPDDIAAEVRRTASNVNISTVYRTLDLLEELGLVKHTHLGHRAPTYSPATDPDHLHLVCRDCGSVTETDEHVADSLVGSLREQHGFETDVQHFAVYGRCRACAKRASRTAPRSTARGAST